MKKQDVKDNEKTQIDPKCIEIVKHYIQIPQENKNGKFINPKA